MLKMLLIFTLWQSPDGKWTRTGEGSSQTQENPYTIIDKYCVPGTATLTFAETAARIAVRCEGK